MDKEPIIRGFELPPQEERLERQEERGLRPLELADFNGQSEIKSKLEIYIQAAKKREEALLADFRVQIDALAAEAGGEVFWEKPLREARRG